MLKNGYDRKRELISLFFFFFFLVNILLTRKKERKKGTQRSERKKNRERELKMDFRIVRCSKVFDEEKKGCNMKCAEKRKKESMCEKERERERDRESECVCVCAKECVEESRFEKRTRERMSAAKINK